MGSDAGKQTVAEGPGATIGAHPDQRYPGKPTNLRWHRRPLLDPGDTKTRRSGSKSGSDRWSQWDEIGWVHYPEIGWSHSDEIRWVQSLEILQLCKVLGVSRSGFLQWRKRGPSDRELANRSLDAQVAVIHAEGKQGYGRIRVTRRLRQSGMRVGAERVRKSLLRQSLRSVYRRKYRVTTDSNHRKPVAQNLLDRRFDGWAAPNRAWTTDISYVLTDEGWLYLAAIVDLGTRRIVGWAMRERMSAKLVCDALQMAYWRRRPTAGLLMHSDRGSQYASDDYRKLLKQFHMTQSMSRRGNCWDNAPMESFFKTLKVERTYRLQYTSRDQARLDIVNWIEGFYNEKRLHSAIDYRSPADFERSLKAA